MEKLSMSSREGTEPRTKAKDQFPMTVIIGFGLKHSRRATFLDATLSREARDATARQRLHAPIESLLPMVSCSQLLWASWKLPEKSVRWLRDEKVPKYIKPI